MKRTGSFSDSEIETFIREGYVHIPRVIDAGTVRDIVDALVVALAWEQGIDVRHPGEFRATLGRRGGAPFTGLNTARFLDALAALLDPASVAPGHLASHGCFFFSFPGFHRPPWRAPYGFGPWHVDLGYDSLDHYDLYSGNCALVPIFLLTPTQSGSGATVLLPGSHRLIAKLLHAAGGRLPRYHVTAFCEHVATQRHPVREAIGEAGDLYLLHPLLIHSASLNSGRQMRVICNTGIGQSTARRPIEDGGAHSAVERAIGEAIDELEGVPTRAESVRRLARLNFEIWSAKHHLRDLLSLPWEHGGRWLNPALSRVFSRLGGRVVERLVGPLTTSNTRVSPDFGGTLDRGSRSSFAE